MGGLTEGSIFSGFPAIASPLAQFMIQLIVILGFTRLLGFALKPLKQPAVIAEVIAGILLGPSAFSRIPAFKSTIFPDDSLPKLQLFANVALVLFMFTVGLELDFKVLTSNLRKSVAISIVGILLPFGLGAGVAAVLDKTYPPTEDTSSGYTSFVLFGGTAMSITAFPVLARILSEQQLLGTRLGATVMNAAAVDDVIAWTVLAVVIAISRATSPLSALWTILSTLAFVAGMFIFVSPLLKRIAIAMSRKDKEAGHNQVPVSFFVLTVLLCLASAYVTELLGVHAIFGAFVCGIAIPRHRNLHIAIGHKIEDLVVAIFLPLYFTFSGLRTRFNALEDGTAWGMVVLVISAAMLGKLGGCTLAAKVTGLNWRESLITGTFMNAKGLVELIVLNVGLDLGVLSPLVFAIFVFMALATTFTTVPLVNCIYPPHLIREHDAKLTREEEAREAAKAAAAPAGGVAGATGVEMVKGGDGSKATLALTGPGGDAGDSAAPGSSAASGASRHVSGVQSVYMAAFGPAGAASLVSVAAALLPRATTDSKPATGRAELCHLLPVTDRPSSYLHTMTQSVVTRVPASALLLTDDPNAPPADAHAAADGADSRTRAVSTAPDSVSGVVDPAAVSEIETDMALLLGIERARHLRIADRLLLSHAYAADAGQAVLAAASGADMILVSYDAASSAAAHGASGSSSSNVLAGAGGSTPASGGSTGGDDATTTSGTGVVGGFIDALVDRFVPAAQRSGDTMVRSLISAAPALTRIGVLVGPASAALFGTVEMRRALIVVTDLQVDQGLLRTVGAALASNRVSLQVLLVTDIASAGLERGSRKNAAGVAVPATVVEEPTTPGSTVSLTETVNTTGSTTPVGQRTLDETARLLGQKVAIGRALAGSGASLQVVTETAEGVHVAHHTALDVALRALNADVRRAYGAGFDLVVVSGPAASRSVQVGGDDAAAVNGSAVEVELTEPVGAVDAATGAPGAPSTPIKVLVDGSSPTIATGADAGGEGGEAGPLTLTSPAQRFPEIAGRPGADAINRRSSHRARGSTLAAMFTRNEQAEAAPIVGHLATGSHATGSGSASVLGAAADRVLAAGLGCSVLVCISTAQPEAAAAGAAAAHN